MRIKENFHDGDEIYSTELKKRVEQVFQFTSQVEELKRLFSAIKQESVPFRAFLLTDEEQKERSDISSDFDAKIQETVYSTLKNLEAYQQFGWKELITGGDDDDERTCTTQ